MNNLFYLVPLIGLGSLIFALILSNWVTKQDAGDDKMKSIAAAIADGDGLARLSQSHGIRIRNRTDTVIAVGVGNSAPRAVH